MSRNKLLVGGLVIIAAIVIAYFAFVYPPVSKEDTSGAIGVAKKYRTEQITDRDVILKEDEAAAAAAMAMMSPEEKAAMFERTTGDLQARTLGYSPDVATAMFARADNKLLARMFQGMDAKSRVDLFERAPVPVQQAVCKAVGVTTEAYAKLDLSGKADKLAKAPDVELAAVVKAMDEQGRRDVMARTEVACRTEAVNLLDRTEKVTLLERAPAEVLARMDKANFEARFFENLPLDQREAMLAKSPEVVSDVFARADNKVLARMFQGMDAKSRVDLFERAPVPVQQAVCKAVGVTTEAYSKLNLDGKVEKLAKAPDVEMAAVVRAMDDQGRRDVMARTEVACRTEAVNLLDRANRVTLMGRAPAKVTESLERAYTEMEKTSREQK
jgi:Mg/Co/Ni transporter MgtE